MRILAMDTATGACSVALMCDGAVVERRFEAMSRGQAEALAPMIEDVLGAAGVAADTLDLLAVTVGPGAFTGLRIGLAMARGLGLAANVPCLGLTTTEVIAQGVDEAERADGTLLVALDSKRSDLYVQAFAPGPLPAGEVRAVEPRALGPYLIDMPGPIRIAGDAAALARAALKEAALETRVLDGHETPDAAVMTGLAAGRWSAGASFAPPSPLYLRPPDAKLPRDGGRLRP